tara:strand:- start:124 stop:651 length:528 start_codon:yes stop_codon:yes gene_type:complete
MDLDDFNSIYASSSSNKRQEPILAGASPRYHSCEDLRGKQARQASVAMGIDEESGLDDTGYLVEVRRAGDHVRISAHAASYAKETLLFDNGSVIEIELDSVRQEARQTVFSRNGDIEQLVAGWSYQRNGFHGPYERISLETDRIDEYEAKWSQYEGVIISAEELSVADRHPPLSR